MPDDAFPTVIKVGGSLFDLPDLGNRLTLFLRSLGHGSVVLVPGGGATANVVRDWDRVHGLGEETAHWLALRSLTLNAYWLQRIIPQASIVNDPVGDSWQIVDAHAFALCDENQPGALPHVWEATSDSIAARVAVVSRARRLLLLKSITVPKNIDWQAAGELGWVDPLFSSVIRNATWPLEVKAINFRHWRACPTLS